MARLAFMSHWKCRNRPSEKQQADCKRVDSGITEPVTLPKGRYIF